MASWSHGSISLITVQTVVFIFAPLIPRTIVFGMEHFGVAFALATEQDISAFLGGF